MLASKNGEHYVISENFDKTPSLFNLHKLGDIIVSGHVMNLIFRTFCNVDAKWASKNPATDKKFFSLSYPTDVINVLGYSPWVEEKDPDHMHYQSKKSRVIK